MVAGTLSRVSDMEGTSTASYLLPRRQARTATGSQTNNYLCRQLELNSFATNPQP